MIPGYSIFEKIGMMLHRKGEMRRIGKPPEESDMDESTI